MTTVWSGPTFFTQKLLSMDADIVELMLGPGMKPVRWDDDMVPVFDSEQVAIWGLPDW